MPSSSSSQPNELFGIPSTTIPIIPFFTKFRTNGFKVDVTSTFEKEFNRLAKHMKWGHAAYHRQLKVAKQVAQAQSANPSTVPADVVSTSIATCTASENAGVGLSSRASESGSDYTQVNTPALSDRSGVQLLVPSVCGSNYSQLNTPAASVTSSSYFSSFLGSGFTPDPSSTLEDDFERLSLQEGWRPGSSERVAQWRRALESELEAQFGEANKLESWQALCAELGVRPIPTSITQCRKALAKKHVCIKELVTSRREAIRQRHLRINILDVATPLPSIISTTSMAQMGIVAKSTIRVFKSVEQLMRHCRKTKSFFPKVTAKEDGFLKALLRHLNR